MEETARAVCHLRTHFPTYFPAMSLSVHPRRSCPHPQLTEEAARPRHPHPKASRTSYLRRSCLNSELTEAAAQLANPHQPSNSTVYLQQHCPHAEPTREGERHLTTRRTTNSTMNSTVRLEPSCLRSELMEEAAQLASHPCRVPSWSVLRKVPQARVPEQQR